MFCFIKLDLFLLEFHACEKAFKGGGIREYLAVICSTLFITDILLFGTCDYLFQCSDSCVLVNSLIIFIVIDFFFLFSHLLDMLGCLRICLVGVFNSLSV